MIGWDAAILIIVICSALSLLAAWKGVLTKGGSLTAFFVGVTIGIMGHFTWVILLLVFFLTSFLATKYKFEYKKSHGLQEGKKGERRTSNVLANGAVPILIAILAGLAIRNTVGLPAIYDAGLILALKRILRIGVALLGIRLSLIAVGSIGLFALPIVIGCIASALLLVSWIGRAVGHDKVARAHLNRRCRATCHKGQESVKDHLSSPPKRTRQEHGNSFPWRTVRTPKMQRLAPKLKSAGRVLRLEA